MGSEFKMKKVLIIGSLILTLGAVGFSKEGRGNNKGGDKDAYCSTMSSNSGTIIKEKKSDVKNKKLNTEIGTAVTYDSSKEIIERLQAEMKHK